MVQALNLILLTAIEVRFAGLKNTRHGTNLPGHVVQTAELRAVLKTSADNRQGAALFTALYPSWCHSAVAAVSLCLLSQVRGSM